jgi:hypothetical protein
MASALFNGSAALSLPALGGSSIPPVQFGLLFVYLRILVPRGGYGGALPDAILANRAFVLFSAYAIVLSYIGPRLFEGAIDVFPLRPISSGPFDTIRLAPTPQNLTSGFYHLGALLLALAAYMLCRTRGGPNAMVSITIWSGWFLTATGLLDLVSRGTPAGAILEIFRNGEYGQLDQSVDGFVRIRGVLPEPSSYAGMGFAFFLLNAELWYRSVRTKATGAVAAALALLLVLSTSSTAYVALAGYALFFLIRLIVLPGSAVAGKIQQALIACFLILFALSIALIVAPELTHEIYSIIVYFTANKATSFSGQQRLFWAMQGWDAFVASFGLGVGPGSFRSSSLFMAILGSVGVIGIVTFFTYLIAIFQPLRASTWGKGGDASQSIGGALAAASVLGLIPAAIISSQSVPDVTFSLFAGAAIALRPRQKLPIKREMSYPGRHSHIDDLATTKLS